LIRNLLENANMIACGRVDDPHKVCVALAQCLLASDSPDARDVLDVVARC
jgi:hypothetical protein